MSMWQHIYDGMAAWQRVIYSVGIIWSIWAIVSIVRTSWYYLGKSYVNMLDIYGRRSYALVTGCTEGIGKGFAETLAKRGFNLVLISRTQAKLDVLRDDIMSRHNIQVITIALDFTKFDGYDRYEKLAQELGEVDVSILVNNVGVDVVERFEDLKTQELRNLLMTNLNPLTWIQRFMLKKLASRKRSAVITVSSIAGRVPVHHMNAYSGTKSFGKMLSDCNAREYKNIDFIALCPSKVSTAMNNYMPTNIFTVAVDQCVDSCINDLLRGYQVTDGHLVHKINSTLIRNLYPVFAFVWENYQLAVMRKERNLPPPKII